MPNPNSIVDLVRRLDPAMAKIHLTQPTALTVHLQGGASVQLDMTRPSAAVFADLLDEVRRSGNPVYLEVDPTSRQIGLILFPAVLMPSAVPPTGVGNEHEVEFIPSHARHFLRTTNPDYGAMLAMLNTALKNRTPLLVTATPENHEIIDVRPVPPGAPVPLLLAPPGGRGGTANPHSDAPPSVLLPPGPEPGLLGGITPSQAQQAFSLVNDQTCNPSSPASTCIPFLYPDDGCWARAHEMCRLMLGTGLLPMKIWIYHTGPLLRVNTRNHPSCEVQWTYHVAPILEVGTGPSMETLVVDPAMFGGPVPRATWVAAQHNPSALVLSSGPEVYFRDRTGGTVTNDPNYTFQNSDLPTYRRALRVRSATVGPPPYAVCP